MGPLGAEDVAEAVGFRLDATLAAGALDVGSKYTKRYTEEFKRDAIALVDSSGKTVTAVARELGISSESLRGWSRRAKADRGEGEPGELTSDEREELKRLRKEVRERQQTIEILKKATAFFVNGERPVSELYRFIHAEKANYPVVLLCRLLKVARLSYYARCDDEAAAPPASPTPNSASTTRAGGRPHMVNTHPTPATGRPTTNPHTQPPSYRNSPALTQQTP
ncbi:transposase [Streptomyces sp. NPDC101149]|uniref:transposase n=1 Tax=Streptomyces sp. NPDC101149 TaxID=3366113 RepID=UPI0037F22674